MELNEEVYERIDAYLSGMLSPEERVIFERELTGNSGLQKLVDEQKTLHLAIEEQGLRKSLDDIHLKVTQSQSNVKPLWQSFWFKYVAAAAIGLIMIWGGMTFSRKQNPNETLFATHFKPDPGLPTTMSSTNNFKFFEAMVAYKQGNYKTAISSWEGLLKSKPENDTLNYFLGVAHLANNSDSEAITFLQWAITHDYSHFLSDAYYYLGLAHIKAGDFDKAALALKKSKHPKSKVVLDQLPDIN